MAAFEDTFTTVDDTLLTAHTPDVGAAWTLISGDNNCFICKLFGESSLRADTDIDTFVASDDLGSPDCFVVGQNTSIVSGKYIALRVQDINNFIGWYVGGSGGGGGRLVKRVGGEIKSKPWGLR